MNDKIYRLVSDYGFGDVAWLERGLNAEQILEAWKRTTGSSAYDHLTLQELVDNDPHPIYRIEEDDWNEEHPDTFLDS